MTHSQSNQTLRIHNIISATRVNGPGVRVLVHTQGCSLRCRGCFNPETHDPTSGIEIPVRELADRILSNQSLEGLTISGGEPTDQLEAVTALVRIVKQESTFSVVLFSGRTLEQIQQMAGANELLALLDVLIDGPYEHSLHTASGLRGSTNQRVRLLTDRYQQEDLTPPARVEVTITSSGEVTVTGFPEAVDLAQELESGRQP